MSAPFALATYAVLAEMVAGDGPHTTYRKMWEIKAFFDVVGIRNLTATSTSRQPWTREVLMGLDRAALARVCEAVVDPSEFRGLDAPRHEDAAAHLNSFLASQRAKLVFNGVRYDFQETTATDVDFGADVLTMIDGDSPYVEEQVRKCGAKLAAKDYDGAITNARTLIEAVLVELEGQLAGSPNDYKGDLSAQFKAVAKRLGMDTQRDDLDARFKEVVRGLVAAVNGIAPIRNKMSEGHARAAKPASHHARFVVNAAKTIAMFLVESYDMQRRRKPLTKSEAGAKE